MSIGRKKLGDNLQRVRDNIAAASAKVRREPADVQLVAVTKSADLEDIKTAIELGVTELAESRVQQMAERAAEVQGWLERKRSQCPLGVRWHMVGHLQRNKVRLVLEVAAIIHSVDSLRLAEEINGRSEQAGKIAEVLVEVNCSEEPQKSGVAVGAAAHLAEQICTLRNVRVVGLMTMAPLSRDPEGARPTFVRLREIFEEMRRDGVGGKDFRHLSMGMSQDYGVAVEEGATMVRIGTALFT